MNQREFDGLRVGDKICRRLRPDETLTVLINDAGFVVAAFGEKAFDATRLINPVNWGFPDRPGTHLTEEEFDSLKIGDRVKYPHGTDREIFTIVLNDGDWIIAVKSKEKIEVVRLKNPGNLFCLSKCA
ncbi:MAG: hypothetical protein G01um101448_578 [Parcubacteria group bacterium Gr01-1014_48]|nr:MAG: hypothetical protein G01um101448_578 [Parcubacteria group bacterium Gr01-1014_48]